MSVTSDGEGRTDSQGEPRTKEDAACGWGFITPALCQRFRTSRWLLFVLCCACFVQNMAISGFVNVIISSIERRYDLTSAESGLVASAYDISSAILILPVSYFGGLGSKPRYISVGFLLFGLSCILFTFPHYLSGLYDYGTDNGGLCLPGSSAPSSCDGQIISLSNYKYMFYVTMILMGAGCTPLYTLVPAFLEESVSVRSASLYLGIYYGCSILGPALGFVVGGLLLNIYVDFNVVDMDSVTIDSTSSRFVGAWWVGFLVCGVLSVIMSIPLAGFPAALPSSTKYTAERHTEVYKNKKVTQNDATRTVRLTKIWKSLKTLLTNPTYMFLNLASATDGILLVGLSTFMPKFTEAQFGLPSSTAALYVGAVVVPGGAGGTLLGGYLIKRFDLRIKKILQICMALIIGSLVFGLVFIMSCPSISFAGVNILYGSTDIKSTSFLGSFQTDTCHANCGCSQSEFSPVCGQDGVTYYSPCYAGCQRMVMVGSDMQYFNCTCVGNNMTEYDAVLHKCESDCNLPLFMVVFFGIVLLTFVSSIPYLTATIRCVPPDERAFAIGIQLSFTKFLGYIPGPILFGWLIDLSCLVWNSKCGVDGSCFFYDNKQMSNNILAIILAGKAVTTLWTVFAYLCYIRGPKNEKKEHQCNDQHGSQFSSQETFISVISNQCVSTAQPSSATDLQNEQDSYEPTKSEPNGMESSKRESLPTEQTSTESPKKELSPTRSITTEL
ncbi:solute carrier organic anion transporter family member 4A1-like [Mizuhopecten yessoensis]|uniref:Solute carrier organic anion transporter family member n=1 Tax=Mizuhopecten yessoensis TaxID=6573 RepID=A0A210Q3Z8_MIZYE|nr:solute carrier organic anion transporter family member 4A1-like [Mizuhopecten yessoensis]OWF43468.1 Solute carrier organic anion transporter family member 4A1 [Mizuhopecten yessoensis]